MASFTHDGNRYEILERPTFGEIAWIEKQSGMGFEEMGGMTKMAALVVLSMRRSQVPMTWAQVQELSPADFQTADEDEDAAEADPTTAGDSVPAA
jgi:hypothetical protein